MGLFVVLASIAAVISAIVAVNANGHSARSADAAVRSADAAKDASDHSRRSADSAETSVELARSERDRATEISDVDWSYYVSEEGNVEILNLGQSTAYDVTVTIRVEGVRFDLTEEVVESDQWLKCDVSRVIRYKTEEDARSIREWASEGVLFSPGTLDVDVRVTWQSRLGTPYVCLLDSDNPH